MADLQIVPAYKNVEPQYVEMKVPLYSYGCERKVKKALSNLRGIYSVNVDYPQQKVTVWGICNKYDVLATIKNKRKEAQFWNPEDNIKMEENERDNYRFSSNTNNNAILTRAKSFSVRALRKVFIRTHSF
ncbi:heavy metal-associated isoprenylated plant protein 28 [Amaranthus tricolor]|uniref:heavy metal-associated isoprenylated plant protein 28 n=1 Tax=Amaranthus tricolor TaxID=29722 RepID=UPI0025852F83|nr:heavy metal-associated isoprenylated plant protein 28 [Amaranthus tricolor]